MQGAGEENHVKSPSDEEYFIPTRNFKHKKYLRSKFEEAMMVEANSTLSGYNKREKVMSVATAAAQPPLPPNPPPPDSPPMILHLKQEIIDDGYEMFTGAPAPETKAPVQPAKPDELENKPTVTMCRNFARGTCKKGAACIFAHELILSQLPGVYTFCRNFQNSVCSFPKCKFVHATVFEKEHFFRTGYLPPHTLAHLKEATVQPPPQAQHFEEVPAELPLLYSNHSALSPSAGSSPDAGIFKLDPSVLARVVQDLFGEIPKREMSSKRAWGEIGEVSSSSRDLDSGEPVFAKKCKKCGSKELRVELAMLALKKKAHAKKDQAKTIALITSQSEKLRVLVNKFCMQLQDSSGIMDVNDMQKIPEEDIYYFLTN